MPPPRVSVLMPAYNAERYVAEAVESILAQTLTDFEFVILDDGSSDRTPAILRRYAARDGRIRLFERAHQGFAAGLNEGLRLARAPLVARMDADDRCHPERLERQARHLDAHPEDVAVGADALRIDPEGLPISRRRHARDHEAILRKLLEGTGRTAFTHPALTVRRAAALRTGGYDGSFTPAEDVLFVLRLAEEGRLANLPAPLIAYRMHPESMCHSDRQRHRRQVERIIRQERVRRGLPSTVPDFYRQDGPTRPLFYHLKWAWQALRSGFWPTACKHLVRAFRLDPLFPLRVRLLARVVPPRNALRFLRRHLSRR